MEVNASAHNLAVYVQCFLCVFGYVVIQTFINLVSSHLSDNLSNSLCVFYCKISDILPCNKFLAAVECSCLIDWKLCLTENKI